MAHHPVQVALLRQGEGDIDRGMQQARSGEFSAIHQGDVGPARGDELERFAADVARNHRVANLCRVLVTPLLEPGEFGAVFEHDGA